MNGSPLSADSWVVKIGEIDMKITEEVKQFSLIEALIDHIWENWECESDVNPQCLPFLLLWPRYQECPLTLENILNQDYSFQNVAQQKLWPLSKLSQNPHFSDACAGDAACATIAETWCRPSHLPPFYNSCWHGPEEHCIPSSDLPVWSSFVQSVVYFARNTFTISARKVPILRASFQNDLLETIPTLYCCHPLHLSRQKSRQTLSSADYWFLICSSLTLNVVCWKELQRRIYFLGRRQTEKPLKLKNERRFVSRMSVMEVEDHKKRIPDWDPKSMSWDHVFQRERNGRFCFWANVSKLWMILKNFESEVVDPPVMKKVFRVRAHWITLAKVLCNHHWQHIVRINTSMLANWKVLERTTKRLKIRCNLFPIQPAGLQLRFFMLLLIRARRCFFNRSLEQLVNVDMKSLLRSCL